MVQSSASAAGQPTSRTAVAVTRRRIAAWMIVSEHDSRASVERRIGNDRTEREVGAAFVAAMSSEVEAVRLVVEMRDPEAFAKRVRVRDAAGEEFSSSSKAVQLKRKFGTLISHSEAVPYQWGRGDRNRI